MRVKEEIQCMDWCVKFLVLSIGGLRFDGNNLPSRIEHFLPLDPVRGR